MAAYATVSQLHARLPQTPAGADVDVQLQDALDAATRLVDGEIAERFHFAGYAEASARRFNAAGGPYLRLPGHLQGSLAVVRLLALDPARTPQGLVGLGVVSTAPVTITDYEVEWEDHRYLYRPYGWPAGRYEATANWGDGDAPADVVEITLQAATNLWLMRQRGMFTDTVGTGEGALTPERVFTWGQRDALRRVRNELFG